MEDSDNEEPDHYLEQMKMEGELKDIEDGTNIVCINCTQPENIYTFF